MYATHKLHFTNIILVLVFSTTLTSLATTTTTSIPQELLKGFSSSPLSTSTSFQPILTDPTGNFSLGFLRHNQNDLKLAVVHTLSLEPLWTANPTHTVSWSHTTRLFFNGSLVLWDPQRTLSWSTTTNGERVVLLNTSNLQVQSKTPLWESFHFPTNTLVQDQNFTSNMSLVSTNNLYSLRLGDTFMGLYENHDKEKGSLLTKRLVLLYWKRSALQAKSTIIEGDGPIYARVSTEGYIGMYQTSYKPADVQKFNSFQETSSFLLVRLEQDGNLKGYYWDSTKSSWILNFQAISETCELPNPCGSYGLCTPGGSSCSCLDNKARFEPGGCFNDDDGDGGGDLCSGGIGEENSYKILRKVGVEPPHKELLEEVTTLSLTECEGLCEKNCKCWGALYNNQTGFCYVLDYTIGTMLGTGDESKVGYFKVRKGARRRNRVGVIVGIVVSVLVGIVVVGVVICVVRWKKRKGGMKEEDENWALPGPYRNLGSESFRSVEMSSTSSAH
ncbi:putative S-locus glycoprotein [Medicago truncatula]|uniref:D-mannose-binding lectin protein, putative n=1 Tax=Medicago truncatula TaxID=3880 RepID=G7L503_MEDTR|nr:PAN domain-containing protein At5g03700 [Medicago truncatula]AES81970.1 D-mannose-binding lectin protein, putative [Medicago truncatula]RHN48626.1 putative S-locus glycoprotein [Medicago truncatula]